MGKILNTRLYYDIKIALDTIKSTTSNPYISRMKNSIMRDLDLLLNYDMSLFDYPSIRSSILTTFHKMWSKHKVYNDDPILKDMTEEAFQSANTAINELVNYFDDQCNYSVF